jgi:hypothetical protein
MLVIAISLAGLAGSTHAAKSKWFKPPALSVKPVPVFRDVARPLIGTDNKHGIFHRGDGRVVEVGRTLWKPTTFVLPRQKR